LNGGTDAEAPMTSAGGNSYTGCVALGAAFSGNLEISCHKASGEQVDALDAFVIRSVSTNGGTLLYSPSGRVNLFLATNGVSTATTGIVYESSVPVFVPQGFAHSNQVGAAVWVAVAAGFDWGGTNATLNIGYADSDVAGMNESSVKLYGWDTAGHEWQEVPASVDQRGNMVSAGITHSGVYVVLADPANDVTAPAAVADLVAQTGTSTWEVVLTWTAPGDDGLSGTVAEYVLKYSPSLITAETWSELPAYNLRMNPGAAGGIEQASVKMPSPGTMYYFGLKARDEAGNESPLSNVSAARSESGDADGNLLPDQWERSVGLLAGLAEDPNADTDHDGLTTLQEYQFGTNPNAWDTDGDGMGDGWEVANGLNPNSALDGALDNDGDGLSNQQEYQVGTNPNAADSDGDGMPDGWELDHGLDPASASGANGAGLDSDHDGLSNYQEYVAGSDPHNAAARLEIKRATRNGPQERTIRFLSSTGRIYDVLYRTNLLLGDWQYLLTNQPGTGTGTNTVTDTNAAAPRMYYQIRGRMP
jgi:hypothetical protein